MVTEDVTWLALAGDEVAVESNSKAELVNGIKSYFSALPSVRSSIGPAAVSGPYVAVEERVSWKSKSGESKSQAALAVYQVHMGKIKRVWYYPAHK